MSKIFAIKELFNFEKGSLQSSKAIDGEFDFITASSEWKKHNSYDHNKEALIIAVAASGSLGRVHYVNGKFISSDLCFILTPKNQNKFPINLNFYHLLFKTIRDDLVKKTATGTSKLAINQTNFAEYQIRYFEIKYQNEIAEKLKISEEKQKNLQQQINNQKNYFKNLKKQILQDAIEGKLTKNWEANPNIEPANELLKKISQEKQKLIAEKKIKKEKPLPAINENEIPFDLPKNWVWVRLGEVIFYAENLDIQKKLNPNSQISYVDIDSIDNYNHRIMRIKYKKVSELSSRARRVLKKGFLLYSTVRPYLENIAFVDNDKENYIGSTGFNVFKTLYADLNYIFYFLLSPNLNIKLKELMIGFNSPSITNLQFESILVPLPPLAEQLAIVLKLQILMQKIDEAEQQIEKSLEYSKQLSACLLAEAFCKS